MLELLHPPGQLPRTLGTFSFVTSSINCAIRNLARLAFSVSSLSTAAKEMKLIMDVEVRGLLPNDALASTAG
jgi:hypothetical protein